MRRVVFDGTLTTSSRDRKARGFSPGPVKRAMQVKWMVDLRCIKDVPRLQLADDEGLRMVVALAFNDEVEPAAQAHFLA